MSKIILISVAFLVVNQLLREWPPGYGGVERVAHELGNFWGGAVFSLDVQRQARLHDDSLPVLYLRKRLRSIRVFGRLHLPLPSRSLISFWFPRATPWSFALSCGFDAFGLGTFAASSSHRYSPLALFSRESLALVVIISRCISGLLCGCSRTCPRFSLPHLWFLLNFSSVAVHLPRIRFALLLEC